MPLVNFKDASYEYIIYYRGKTRISLKVKDGIIIVSAPPKTKEKKILDLLIKNQDKLVKLLKDNLPLEEVHINNIAYKPRFVIGKHNFCYIENDEIVIVAKKANKSLFRKVLYTYYKHIVETEIKKLMPLYTRDFDNIPPIDVKDYKGNRLGVCRFKGGKYTITLSAKLAKYDWKFIKVVLYHELSHVGNMNHSSQFYQHFDSKLPNAKQLQKELKAVKYRDCI